VSSIGSQLQETSYQEENQEIGRELISIAQANISLINKLGISAHTFTGVTLSSGIEEMKDSHFFAEETQYFVVDEKTDNTDSPVNVEDATKSAKLIPDASQAEISAFFAHTTPGTETIIPRGMSTTDSVSSLKPTMAAEPVPEPEPKPEPKPEPQAEEPTDKNDTQIKSDLATFSRFYESRDHGLCVFEDADGHLIALKASNLV
jgi:hypothetical protein